MKLKQKGMKWLLALHIISSSIWFGASVCIAILSIFTFSTLNEAEFLRVAPLIPKLYLSVVLPAGIITLVQGLIYGFCTKWGFFKQRWIRLKWLLVVLLMICDANALNQLYLVLDDVKSTGLEGGFADGGSVFIFIAIQLVILITIILLSVFKPNNKKKPQTLAGI